MKEENIRIESVDPYAEALGEWIDAAFDGFAGQHGVTCHYTPFAFAAKQDGTLLGVIKGHTMYREAHISELIVAEEHRGKGIGTRLLAAAEAFFAGKGFDNLNLTTYRFQAPEFYRKHGFTLEFIRENRECPALAKYFFVKEIASGAKMKKGLTVTPLTEEDLPCLSGTAYGDMPPEVKLKMLAESQNRRHGDGRYFEVFTLKDGDLAVGFASLYEREKGVASVGLDIREPFRRKGYATRAAAPLAALLTEKGFSAIRTHVRTDNEASLRLHEKLGFIRMGQDKTERGAKVIVFEKRL